MRRRAILLLALAAAAAPESRAQTASNQVYQAIPPCRLADTRVAIPASPLAPNVSRAFHVVGGASLAAQGGSASGCGVPGYGGLPTPSHPRVQAVMLNFTAVAPQGAGNLRAWASGPPPNASVLNYVAASTVANGVVVPLDQDATPGADLLVRADVAATHLVIDVLGYFSERPPLAGEGRGAAVWGSGPNPDFFELCTGPTGVSFGLSDDTVHGADSATACPVGYWVCSQAERGTAACNTFRTNDTCDVRLCNGCVDLAGNEHRGWLADFAGDVAAPQPASRGQFLWSDELGRLASDPECWMMPVWCCTWE
jgi:hypothetical protein